MSGIDNHTLSSIDNAYLKAIKGADNRTISSIYYQLRKAPFKDQINKGTRTIVSLTGFDYTEVRSYIENRAITLCLNEVQKKSLSVSSEELFAPDHLGQVIKYSILTVKSWAYSDKEKWSQLEKDTVDLDLESNTAPPEALDDDALDKLGEINAIGADALVYIVSSREDSREFLAYAVSHDKEQVKEHFKLSEKRYNQKINRALTMIDKNRAKNIDDYQYAMSLLDDMTLSVD